MESLLDLQTCLQYNVAEASSFRNIKHKFPNILYKREHARRQGLRPCKHIDFSFLQRCQSYATFFVLKHHRIPIGLANLFAK